MSETAQILVAEDNPAMGAVVQFNLERMGFGVALVEDGLSAWNLAQQRTFDLVITDQQMPVMDGIELCRRLRNYPDYAETPVIMLTAKGLELSLGQVKDELGLAAVMPKPFSPRALMQTVSENLQHANSATLITAPDPPADES